MSDNHSHQPPSALDNVTTVTHGELALSAAAGYAVEAASTREKEYSSAAMQVYLQHECDDARAMLFDGGVNIQAKLARQLAAAHEAAMKLLNRGQAECNTVEAARLMNVAVRLMTVFQQGVATLRQLQGGSAPTTVQNVRVLADNAVVATNVNIASVLRGGSADKT